MTYTIKELNPISKFKVLGFNNKGDNLYKKESGNFSTFFWNEIFDEENIKKFIEVQFLPFKKGKLNNKEYEILIKESDFLISKISFINKELDFKYSTNPPSGENIFFSYRVFDIILGYYNDFYKDDNIVIDLKQGLLFKKEINNIDDFFYNLDFYYNSDFVKDILNKYIYDYILVDDKIYKFDIFWPEELITVGLISKILKTKDSSIKIVIDFSSANEQLDFSQWINLIKESEKKFFFIIDFFIVYRDYGNGKKLLLDYLNGHIAKEKLENIIFYDKGVHFFHSEENYFNKELIDSFIKNNFSTSNIGTVFAQNSIFARFLPYKCYWDNCNFCAINSQNKIVYDKKYSYSFFVDMWIDFIEQNNIQSINFKDEAIIPTIIISFAQKIIDRGLNINYQFRTRYDKLYTLSNCKILYKSGARFCGMGLESAVERINEEIGNKGNNGIKLSDKIRIIYNFDSVGISIHNYSIIGFPGETDKESAATYKFLKTNIEKSNYFTCTPNSFGLMKGPKIFTDRKELGIEIDETELKNPFKLNYSFTFKGTSRNLKLLYKFQQGLHKTQFCPWIGDDVKYINFKGFWDYIDRSNIFYLIKRYYKKNPFYIYKDINNNIIKTELSDILNSSFNISNYYQIFEYQNDPYIYIYDWVGCKDTVISSRYKNFLINYNSNISLLQNIKNTNIEIDNEFKKVIYLLLNDRILCFKSMKS